MLRNLLTVGSWTMLSRFLGLVRDQLLAALMGAGMVQDAYQIAFRLPNMFRRLFGEGAFNAAFVPLFTTIHERDGKQAAVTFASRALTMLVLLLVGLTLLGEVFMPAVIHVMAPGFSHGNPERFLLAVTYTRITLPYMVFICAAALVAGMLNGLGRFSAAAAAYVSFNIVGIAAIGWAVAGHHDVAVASAWGITLSGVVQFALLMWAAARHGMMPHLARPALTPAIRRLLARMGPGLVGSGVTQLNLTIDTIIATLLPTGSISWLYFADRINQLPLGVLGAALGTTLLPLLSRHAAQQDKAAMRGAMDRASDYALLLTLPATAGLMAVAPEIMSALFGYGRFGPSDVNHAAQALLAYAVGLPAFVLIKLYAPAFFAEGDTATPVKISMVTLALNLGLNLLFLKPLAFMGPPLASALAAIVNLGLMLAVLRRRALFKPTRAVLGRMARITLAALAMGCLTAWAAGQVAGTFPSWHLPLRVLGLGALVGLGAVLYALFLLGLGVVTLPGLVGMVRARLGRKRAP
ncbi:murein biosynthesis integral membrane protein MurJ [Formicincola oecophyllae]|uniref:Probable lipid II flippase MurJ n=1 Tax=Formicincola oecophyllae TaxID=2558361 RepID=A0A4Y6UDD2_9PROT|nr:murein biosynthesis integral membrane protein MurJ [Formicincola oecophyllae]QDH14457.1 murein biosynthesis integral membrane protein MurJ [Formicincola oecophyllae]